MRIQLLVRLEEDVVKQAFYYTTNGSPMIFSELQTTIKVLQPERITKERKLILQPLVDYLQHKVMSNEPVRLNFICTHNSRRSHLLQVWAQTMAHYFKIDNLFCYSGGTEDTALFPMVAQTLQNSDFDIRTLASGKNPIYSIKYAANEHPIIGFSKGYDDDFNPTSEFAAIMTCAQADGNCPFIAGAEKRIAITFEDPKAFDNTPQEAEMYNKRSLQIATELLFVFSQINA